MSRYRMAAILSAILLLLGIVGRMDLEAAEDDQAQYCEMVKGKLWPDFRGIYRTECLK